MFGGIAGFRWPAVVVLACAVVLVRTGVCGPRGRRTMGAMAISRRTAVTRGGGA